MWQRDQPTILLRRAESGGAQEAVAYAAWAGFVWLSLGPRLGRLKNPYALVRQGVALQMRDRCHFPDWYGISIG